MTDYVLAVEGREFLFDFNSVGITQFKLPVEVKTFRLSFSSVGLYTKPKIGIDVASFAVTANTLSFHQSYNIKLQSTSFFILPSP